MQAESLTEKQLLSRAKSKNYIPPEVRNLEKIIELRKARQKAKHQHTLERRQALKIRRQAELKKLDNEAEKELEKTNKDTSLRQCDKIAKNMMLYMNFILANPDILNLLQEFDSNFIGRLITARNRINMVLKLHKKKSMTAKEKKLKKRAWWIRKAYCNSDSDSSNDIPVKIYLG